MHIAGLVLGGTTTGLAASAAKVWSPGGNVMCLYDKRTVACALNSGDGYMVGINNQLVQVNDSHGHKVFRRVQP